MNWHYLNEKEQQVGPVTEADFNFLIQSGKISANTLVWREGMPEWVRQGDLPQTASAAAAAMSLAPTATVTATVSHRCVECGNTFPDSEMIAFENAWVCAACKPQFVQKLKEGVAPSGTLQYAGFWIRFCAQFIDGLIMQAVNFLIIFVVAAAIAATVGHKSPAAAFIPSLFGFIFAVSYVVFFNGRFGATPGKMALKLKIVRPNGEPIGYGRALGRYFGQMLSSLILCIGFMMAGWDEQKRALHDRLCDTRVIRR